MLKEKNLERNGKLNKYVATYGQIHSVELNHLWEILNYTTVGLGILVETIEYSLN